METVDKRSWSITARNLSEFMGDLKDIGILSSDVHTLARKFRERNIYPARDFEHRCNKRPPDIFISYHWKTNFIDLQETIWVGLDLIADIIRQVYPSFYTEPLIADELGIWVDFMFIDQSARDIKAELDVLPQIIESTDVQFVLGPTALTRSWCCYEFALFNKRFNQPDGMTLVHSFVAPTAVLQYRGWEGTLTTNPQDKIELEEKIARDFEKGILGFDALMIQASLIGELAAHPQAAIDQTQRAAEKWIKRRSSNTQENI